MQRHHLSDQVDDFLTKKRKPSIVDVYRYIDAPPLVRAVQMTLNLPDQKVRGANSEYTQPAFRGTQGLMARTGFLIDGQCKVGGVVSVMIGICLSVVEKGAGVPKLLRSEWRRGTM
ncbi:unnamed protein product [Protopolystoma xenopodis]|uniref:Uncharacterized protein n=1 Tax=Protopolystoma xenopodis TaxID=117903 RepID=A0A3S5CV48_9PLAT|nr:unnamed protein product [Protopolystoma xenopodis]